MAAAPEGGVEWAWQLLMYVSATDIAEYRSTSIQRSINSLL